MRALRGAGTHSFTHTSPAHANIPLCIPRDIGDDEHVLPLEDDIQVSPFFYWWLLRAQRSYGDFDDGHLMRTRGLVGVSLYTPRLNEIAYPQQKWLPDRATASTVFVLQVPCSWGALFLGSAWRDFLKFYHMRVKKPFFDFAQEAAQRGIGKNREPLGDPSLALPRSRSNVWPRSWKRFLIDFMYGRGYVMLYPNMREQRAFSTTFMERGDHTAKDGLKETVEANTIRRDVDPLKTVPLVQHAELSEMVGLFSTLPSIEEVPIFDLHHRRRTMDMLASQGFAFTENVRWWGRRQEEVGISSNGNKQRGGGGMTNSLEYRQQISQQYVALAEEWSGVPAAPSGGGCAIDTPPRGIGIALPPSAPPSGSSSSSSAPTTNGASKRYLVYQPPAGLGEWFVSLRNAIGIAKSLGRTLVVPHLFWEGSVSAPTAYSSIYSWATLQAVVPDVIEVDAFLDLGLSPRALILLHVKDPRLLPARLYFDALLHWYNVTGIHMPAQMTTSADYIRLYGGCEERVLALSTAYAAFDGFPPSTPEHTWFTEQVYPALWTDTAAVESKAAMLMRRLRRDTGRYTCLHLTDLDAAVLTSHAPDKVAVSNGGSDSDGEGLLSVDVAEPAARSVPFGGHFGFRVPTSVCDGYDAEAQSPIGRMWVQQLYEQGVACSVDDDIIAANLPRLPSKDPVFVLADGQRLLPDAIAEGASVALKSDFIRLADLLALVGTQAKAAEWPTIEQAVCAGGDTILFNEYSPLSQMLWRRAVDAASKPRPNGNGATAAGNAAAAGTLAATSSSALTRKGAGRPKPLRWARIDSDMCMPLFTRTARFDIQPNRFGILGQFGPDRKLQLATTNLSAMVGWDGRLLPNASIELEVYVSNESHVLHIFEYTKENNQKGVNFQIPSPLGGWREHTWHSFTIHLSEQHYSYPASTPWHVMDRLELYYGAPHHTQPLGDYIRIRNVYVRSTRSFRRLAGESSKGLKQRDIRSPCRELDLVDKLRRLRAYDGSNGGGNGGNGKAANGRGRGGRRTTTRFEVAAAAAAAAVPTTKVPAATVPATEADQELVGDASAKSTSARGLKSKSKKADKWNKLIRRMIPWLIALFGACTFLFAVILQICGIELKAPCCKSGLPHVE